ncbi:hypothetical protein FSP39_012567 [Pinctada imbricata]|uniref:Uncharacterized protein n=1 Tax=Pinctada imbricata TaxID=66713 RepID=A0AA88Y464_PINIB|nr:hypothetical protein FSP39_012567 [Pinctada imbricata]
MTVHVLFHSSVIEDASPPECDIAWNGTYLSPHQPIGVTKANTSLLPGCWTAESREGYHMTYYWFHLFDWIIN